jgi:hypothetical protein
MLDVAQGTAGCEAEADADPSGAQALATASADDADATLDVTSADDEASLLLPPAEAAPEDDGDALDEEAPGTSALVASVGAVSSMVGLTSDAIASDGIVMLMVVSALLLLEPSSWATTCAVPVSS